MSVRTDYVTVTYRDSDGDMRTVTVRGLMALEKARAMCMELEAGEDGVADIKATCQDDAGRDVDMTVSMGVGKRAWQ